MALGRTPMWSGLCCLALLLIVGSALDFPAWTPENPCRVLFVYTANFDDHGWNERWDMARTAAERKYGTANLVTEYYIEPNISIVNDTLRERLPKGEIAMVVMTSTQYLANVYELAPMFPKVAFVQYGTALSGPPRKNVQSYSLRTMRIRYLQGYLCGLATKTGKVGWVSRAPGVPSAITQNMNYFYIGMKEANPQAELLIGYTAIDVQAVIAGRYVASKLVNDHQVDCLAHQNIDHTPLLGANNDTVLMGWQTDERYLLGEQVWASVDVSFTEHIDVILNTLVLNSTFAGMFNGFVPLNFLDAASLSSLSINMPSEVKRAVLLKNREIIEYTAGDYAWCLGAPYYDAALGRPLPKDGPTNSCIVEANFTSFLPFVFEAGLNPLYNMTNEDATEYIYVRWSDGVAIALLVLLGLTFILCIALFIDILVHRETKVYRASSPLMSFFVLGGIVLMLISCYFWIGEPTMATCNVRYWLAGLGYALIYSCISAKNYRVLKIFTTKSLKVFGILDTELLFKFTFVICAVEIILCVLWVAIMPITVTNAWNSSLLFNESQISCQLNSPVMLILYFAFKGVLLAPAVVISYKSRGIVNDYKESQSIAIAVYHTTVIMIVFITMNFIIAGYVGTFVVQAWGVWILATGILIIFFIPKFWKVHIRGSTTSGSGSGDRTTTNSGSMLDAERPTLKPFFTTSSARMADDTPPSSSAEGTTSSSSASPSSSDTPVQSSSDSDSE